ncbi:hypothetical protein D6833_00990 [Candidatus Parcubacteria bacterium]|nr:MAG: hypothetical protein D6833_00990 [Candidatus Parcubacteria bacterium]
MIWLKKKAHDSRISQEGSCGAVWCAVRGLIWLGILFVVACGHSPSPIGEEQSGDKVMDRLNELYDVYVNGDLAEARRALKEAVRLISSSGDTNVINHGLYFAYGRLYCLEALRGSSNLAAIYFVKAKYWYLRELESVGKASGEIAKALREFSGEKVRSDVLEWDARHTGGRGPLYLRPRKSTNAAVPQEGEGGGI